MKNLRRRISRKWAAVDWIFTEEMPADARRIALRAITFSGRIMADNRYRDCDGNGCPGIIMAEAVRGGRVESAEREMANVLGISDASISWFIQMWDTAKEEERKEFLRRMSAYLESISLDPAFQPVPGAYPIFCIQEYDQRLIRSAKPKR